MKFLSLLLCTTATLALAFCHNSTNTDPYSAPEEDFGRVHTDISCSANVATDFDRALALLHNFWYARALARFKEVVKKALPWRALRDGHYPITYQGKCESVFRSTKLVRTVEGN